MDINTTNLFHNIQTDPAILSKTPFNAIYYSALPENQEHVKITQETVNWVMNEAVPDNIILDANTWNKGEIKAKNSVTLTLGVYTASFKATTGSYIPCVASGGRVGSSNKETVVELTPENISVQENVFDETQIILYPNPTNGMLALIFPVDRAVEIEIVDLTFVLLQ